MASLRLPYGLMRGWSGSDRSRGINSVGFERATAVAITSTSVLIAQGHDWHLLIVTKDAEKMIVSEHIDVGNTRSCFNAMKVVAVLHWLMD